MSYKSNMKILSQKGKGKSTVKYTDVSANQQKKFAPSAAKPTGEDITLDANGVKLAKESQQNLQAVSQFQKDQSPTQNNSQKYPTNPNEETTPSDQQLTQTIGLKRQLEEGQDKEAKKSKITEDDTYLYDFRDVLTCIPPQDYMSQYVRKNGSNYMKILATDYTSWDDIPLNLKLGHDVFKQSANALSLVPSRSFEDYDEMRYPLAFFTEKFVSCVPNQYAIKGVNFVNGVDIIDCFKWLHSIANATDGQDFIKLILGSACLADRHRTKKYYNLIFSDFVIRRLGVAFLGCYTKCDVAKGILQSKDNDINFDSITEHIMNEIITDDDDKIDIWDF